MLWEVEVCIRRPLQSRGLGATARREAVRVCRGLGKEVGWIGGITQNPVAVLGLRRAGRVFPFDEPFATGRGAEIAAHLTQHVPTPGGTIRWHRATGVVPAHYAPGRFGGYPTPATEVVSQWERALAAHGFDRARGDAFCYVCELQESATW